MPQAAVEFDEIDFVGSLSSRGVLVVRILNEMCKASKT